MNAIERANGLCDEAEHRLATASTDGGKLWARRVWRRCASMLAVAVLKACGIRCERLKGSRNG
jgi:hypothetical protein